MAKKASHYRRTYGLDLDQLREMFEAQGGLCPVCLRELRPWSALGPGSNHVDHCHATGKVRGLLCPRCNRLLGCARDETDTLTRAISYLQRSRE
jgi:hypothetical protein